jgi:hypothetical protein
MTSSEDLQVSEVESARDEPLGSWRHGHGAGPWPAVGPRSPSLVYSIPGKGAGRAPVLQSQSAASSPGAGQGHKVHERTW